jgi:tape measure domain-containing protein
MRKATADVGRFRGSVGRASNALVTFRRVATFAAIFGVGTLIKKVVGAGEEMLSFERRLAVLSNSVFKQTDQFKELGSAQEAFAQELNFLRTTALKTGQNFDTLGKAYIRMVPMAASAGISISVVKDALIGTIGAGVVMGATNNEMKRAFIALGQVIGKGVLQMEELRQQLGEAMPNAMIIASDGLTKLNQSGQATFEGIDKGATISIGKMVNMIQQGLITADLFIKAWAIGTEGFKKFAELGALTVTGQLENLRTVLVTGIGRFMLRSGLQSSIVATFSVINKGIDDFLQNMTKAESKAFGSKIIDGIMRVIQWFKTMIDTVTPIISAIVRVGSAVITMVQNVMQSVPREVIDIGILGFLLFGRKGRIVILAALGVSTVIDRIKGRMKEAAKTIENRFLDIPKNLKNLKFEPTDDIIGDRLKRERLARAGNALEELKRVMRPAEVRAFIKASGKERIALMREQADKFVAALAIQQKKLEEQSAKRSVFAGPRKGLFGGLGKRDAIAQTQINIKRLKEVISNINLNADIMEKAMAAIGKQAKKGAEVGATGIDQSGKRVKSGITKWLEQIKETTKKVEEANEKAKELFFGFTPNPQSILDRVPISEFKRIFKKYLAVVNRFSETDTPAGAINAKLITDLVELKFTQKKLEALIEAGKFKGTKLKELDDVTRAFLTGAIRDVVNIKTADTIAELEEDAKARIKFLKSFIEQIVAVSGLGIDAAAALFNKLFNENVAIINRKVTKFGQGIRRNLLNQALEPLNRELAKSKSLFDAQDNALDAQVTKMLQLKVFNAERAIEVLKIKSGEIAAAGAVFSVTDQKRMQLAIEGKIRATQREKLTAELELKVLADKRVTAGMAEAQIASINLAMRKEEIALEARKKPSVRKALLAQELQKITMERENIILQRSQINNAGFRRESLRLEIEKLKFERENMFLEQQLRINPDVQREMLNLELQRLSSERTNLQLQLQQAADPRVQNARTELDILQQRLAFTEQLRLASLTLGQTIQLNLTQAFTNFTSTVSKGITDLIFGVKSLGDVFKSIVKTMITGIIEFFVQWAVKRAAAFVLEQIFGVGVVGIATGTQAAILGISAGTSAAMAGLATGAVAIMSGVMEAAGAAVAAAWLPAATVVSIATFGGAAATGTAALGIAFTAATGMFATFKAATSALGSIPTLHEGGLVGRGNRTGGASFTDLLNDESLAVLQRGELVVPRDFVPTTIAALQGGTNLFASGPQNARFSPANINSDDIEDMTKGKVEIVNLFSMEQVERHLARNPDAVVNIMTTNERNNGVTRSARRR